MRALIPLLTFAVACGCPRPDPGPELHYADFGALRHAVVVGDVQGAAELVRTLDGGDHVRHVSETARKAELDVHSAAGFLMAAADIEDSAEGLAAMARACGDCHRSEGVRWGGSSSGSPETHGLRFEVALRALESGDLARVEPALRGLHAVPFPDGAAGVEALRVELRALEGGDTEQLERVVGLVYARCAACHP